MKVVMEGTVDEPEPGPKSLILGGLVREGRDRGRELPRAQRSVFG